VGIVWSMKRVQFFTLMVLLATLSACGKGWNNKPSVSSGLNQELSAKSPKQYIDKFNCEEDFLPAPKAEAKPPIEPTPADPESMAKSESVEGDFKRGGIITPTIYFNPVYGNDDQACKENSKVALRQKNGNVLAKVCPDIAKECILQGSCTIEEKNELRLFNIETKNYFFEIDRNECKFGYGVRSTCLVPFQTVAADLDIYKPGQVIYIPDLRGMKLPNGRIHNGYLIVQDKGRGIKGAGRFDFFTGFSDWKDSSNPFVKVGLGNKDTDMVYYLVNGSSAKKVLDQKPNSI
jgi:3D (Asp-Asp-Asp) domain-containing protein